MKASPSQQKAEAEAAAWLARLHGKHGAADLEAFQSWRADPEHAAAFDQLTEVWDMAGGLRHVDLEVATAAEKQINRRTVLLGALGGCVALGGFAAWQSAQATVYRTAIGEQRRIRLPDGSRLILDTDSEVRAHVSESQRHMELRRGQAYFAIVRSNLPFVVEAGGHDISANVSALNIRCDATQVSITLFDGKATVLSPQVAPTQLEAGERLIANGERAHLDRPDLGDAAAWQSGRVIFHGDTLAAAVAEMNRYGSTEMLLEPAVAGLQISGSYRTGDSQAFARSIATLLPVRVTARADKLLLGTKG
ncbi:FecR domain-containing protein [Sphingobium sp. BYY-5]|uniref:FecR family protein n=1 Tax=Sphingobium sp. BYY-5 TaxID=2926400 RepID=UPI001FA71BC8|nr:FecR domain-containing protein [Sphingobium sp. BYY-5]MCI4592291.1 FecR domain-containing protein [Sphingobium sp. BYY-5]